jgi:hypothetical protein
MTLDAIETFVLRAALADWLRAVAAPNKLHVCARRIYADLLIAGRLDTLDVALDADDLHSLAVMMHTYAPRPMPPSMRMELAALRGRIEDAERAAAPAATAKP